MKAPPSKKQGVSQDQEPIVRSKNARSRGRGYPCSGEPVSVRRNDPTYEGEPIPIDFGPDYEPGDVFKHVFAGLPGFEDVEAPATAIQRKEASGSAAPEGAEAVAAAQAGFQGSPQTLPHLEAIQASFGSHDVSNISAYVGGVAAGASNALGAKAYAMGDSVAFKEAPDLHTAAHEAAHVVQQRGGVQLKGGMGRAGDAYEQHADRVADLVVAGQSAEDMLSGMAEPSRRSPPGSDVERAPVQRKEHGAEKDTSNVECSPETSRDPALKATLKKIGSKYHWLAKRQRAGVDRLWEHSKQLDPPPWFEGLLKAGAEIALAGALGWVGKAVEQVVLEHVGESDLAARRVASAVSKGAREFAKQSVGAIVASLSGGDKSSTYAFFESQGLALDDTAEKQQELFFDHEEELRTAPNARTQADALLSALNAQKDAALQVQYSKSLDEWANYLAVTEHGDDGTGQPLVENELGELNEEGMLGIRVGAGIPGTKPWIKWAMIDGLNKSMRTNIASRPLGELRITKNIVLDFGFGEFEFAVTPSGDIENKHMSADAHQWLAAHAKAQGATGPEDGLRLLIEDLGNLTLAGKLNPSALKLLAAEAGND